MSTYEDKFSCSEICKGLWGAYTKAPLSMESKPVEEDKYFLWYGLKKVSEQIITSSPYNADTLVVIHAIEISLCDFQQEGLTPAIIEWASKAFNFEAPNVGVSYNKQLNKYEFTY
ncbi:hypothetical protein [Pseudobacteroides cellulosolvens]|nr:hypothetical protein [Pseudobacteroides cellulosolvens]